MALLTTQDVEQRWNRTIADLRSFPRVVASDLELPSAQLRRLVHPDTLERNPLVTVPGFEQTFHLVPDDWLPPEDRKARRQARIDAYRRSPLPESQQVAVRVLTAVDNVQDALVTASVLLRLAAVLQPELAPIAIGAGEAADALNALNLVAGVATNPLSSKVTWKALTKSAFGSQAARARSATTIARAIPAVGEVLQILQTTDSLFGVGISLGPIMGFIPSLIYGLPQNAEIALPGQLPFRPGDDLFFDPTDATLAATRELDRLLGTILRTPADLAEIATESQPLPWEDHFQALLAANLGAELGRAMVPREWWGPLVAPRWFQIDEPLRYPRPELHIELRAAGLNTTNAAARRLKDAHPGEPLANLWRPLTAAAAAAMHGVLHDAPTPKLRAAASALATDYGFRIVRALNGPTTKWEVHDAPFTRVVTDTLELGLLPPADSSESQRKRYLDRATRLYAAPDDPIPIQGLREIFRQVYTERMIPTA